jgi:hypothetical protein
MILIAISIPVALFSLWMLSGYLPTRNIAVPTYTVIAAQPDYEIREYETYIIAETQQERGFNELFQYISGNNTAQTKLSMTAPVLKSEGVAGLKLTMTAPVLKKAGEGSGSIAFVMPPGYTLAELPLPKNPKISLREIHGHRVATVTFSGYASAEIIEEKTAGLLRALMRDGIHAISKPTTALYNPPWTPPFMRKNEIVVDVELPSNPPEKLVY